MQNDSMKTINLKLNNINDLFCEPDYDPFDSQSRFQSGFDELVDQVREFSLKEPLKICLTMAYPPEGADIEGTIKDALNRFCAVKIRECEKSIHEIRSQGKRDLVSGFLLSLVLIFGEFFVVQMRFLPEILT